MKDLQQKIRDRLRASHRILITSHIRPDGDAIGSSLALALALVDAGKQVQVVLSDGLPSLFGYLPGAGLVRVKAEGEFDLIVCLDCSDLKRTGAALNGYRAPDIVIDHHSTTDAFGMLNLVDPEAAATASLLVRSLPGWGLTITPAIAANLMTGLLTDTIGFRTSNTTPEVLRQAASLLELGVDMNGIYNRNLVQRTFPELKYWAAGLTKLQRLDGIAWTALEITDRSASGYSANDDADLINILSSLSDTKITIVFVEQNESKTKVSWRGLAPDVDVSQVARQFGGGGHKAAAGAEITGSLAEVRESVLAVTHKILQHTAQQR